ncbi:hypothetical protein [Nioella sp.]|uniref:DUF6950 family protein n=1 Tax=Nioella sp. TaxID=1912091 RepID=UPI00351977F6
MSALVSLPARLPGWRGRLYRWLAEIAPQPHVYGEHDCALFASGAIRAMHGVDPAENWRGRYTTLAGGLRLLRRDGFQSHVDVLARLGRPVTPALAQIGDFAVVDTPEMPALGIVTGSQLQLLRLDGLASLPLILPGNGGCVAREVWRT